MFHLQDTSKVRSEAKDLDRTFSSFKKIDTSLDHARGTEGRTPKEVLDSLRLYLELESENEFGVKECSSSLEGSSRIEDLLASLNVPRRPKGTYDLRYHDIVASFLKGREGCALVRQIPSSTLRGMKLRKARLASEEEIEAFLSRMPAKLHSSLLPFQREGVKRALQFRGRLLLADAMGVGKTIQAIAVASCFMEDWPLLVVSPASLRLPWADALEHWLPELRPEDILVVKGRRDTLPLTKLLCRTSSKQGEQQVESDAACTRSNRCGLELVKVGDSHGLSDGNEGKENLVPICDSKKYVPFSEGKRGSPQSTSFSQEERCPRVIVTSYRTLAILHGDLAKKDFTFGAVIVDESHRLRATVSNMAPNEEVNAAVSALRRAKRVVLLTGTPSLSRPLDIFLQVDVIWPGLLGKNPRYFGREYCDLRWARWEGNMHMQTSGGKHLHELHLLLKETVMVRRTKEEVMEQLPPKRRQIVILDVGKTLHLRKKACLSKYWNNLEHPYDCPSRTKPAFPDSDNVHILEANRSGEQTPGRPLQKNWYHQLGRAKIDAAKRWISDTLIGIPSEERKVLIFAHHIEVMDELQNLLEELGTSYARIDGSTPPFDRSDTVARFNAAPGRDGMLPSEKGSPAKHSPKGHLQVALISMKAGGTGLDFHTANLVIFAELPLDPSTLFQAEDRAHRRGQTKCVNIYYLCAKGTADEGIWASLTKSTERVSTVANGFEKRVEGVHIHGVVHGQDWGCSGSCNSVSSLWAKEDPDITTSVLKEQDTSNTTNDALLEVDLADLFFKISENTGRVHLYRSWNEGTSPVATEKALAPSGTNNLVEPIRKNFRPEEVHDTNLRQFLPQKVIEATKAFLKEWTSLQAHQQHKLLPYAMRPPLTELLLLIPSPRALGISKRRVSCGEVHGALGAMPDGTQWRSVDWHCPRRDICISVQRPFGEGGEVLCCMCYNKLEGGSSHELDTERRDFFCSAACFQAFLHRTSISTLRKAIFDIEHGVCQICGLDAHNLCARLRGIKSLVQRHETVLNVSAKHPLCPGWSSKAMDRLISMPSEGRSWQMDHILEVAEGGGGCGLENVQTLCVPCHSLKTRQYATRLARAKRQRKCKLEQNIRKRLDAMQYQKENVEQNGGNDGALSDDQDLLVDVPGIGQYQ